jgi:NADH dehydrogenase
VFGIASGAYGIQPVHVKDFARLAVEHGQGRGDLVLDAVGPESFGFGELVRLIRRAVRSRAMVVRIPKLLLLGTARLIGSVAGDVVLTGDEILGLTSNLLVSKGPPTTPTCFSDWLDANADGLGVEWGSELQRHYN